MLARHNRSNGRRSSLQTTHGRHSKHGRHKQHARKTMRALRSSSGQQNSNVRQTTPRRHDRRRHNSDPLHRHGLHSQHDPLSQHDLRSKSDQPSRRVPRHNSGQQNSNAHNNTLLRRRGHSRVALLSRRGPRPDRRLALRNASRASRIENRILEATTSKKWQEAIVSCHFFFSQKSLGLKLSYEADRSRRKFPYRPAKDRDLRRKWLRVDF